MDNKEYKSKLEKIKRFDPNNVGNTTSNIFGFPFTADESEIIIIPVPWEVTASYKGGTAHGPEIIFKASPQIDLYDIEFPDLWKLGIHMIDIPKNFKVINDILRSKAEHYLDQIEAGVNLKESADLVLILHEIRNETAKLQKWIYEQSIHYLNNNKKVVLLGGDHSTPLGLIKALTSKYNDFGILHFDAHLDLRNAYENFKFSHASIMYNCMQLPSIKKFVQVGIRDYCEAEVTITKEQSKRFSVFYDFECKRRMLEGETWRDICKDIINQLPETIYISFDIDAFHPSLCPNTGTPVPGGLQFEEATYLISQAVKAGKKIIGFDLVEVAPGNNEINAIVGARLLYKLCGYLAMSNNMLNAIKKN